MNHLRQRTVQDIQPPAWERAVPSNSQSVGLPEWLLDLDFKPPSPQFFGTLDAEPSDPPILLVEHSSV